MSMSVLLYDIIGFMINLTAANNVVTSCHEKELAHVQMSKDEPEVALPLLGKLNVQQQYSIT